MVRVVAPAAPSIEVSTVLRELTLTVAAGSRDRVETTASADSTTTRRAVGAWLVSTILAVLGGAASCRWIRDRGTA